MKQTPLRRSPLKPARPKPRDPDGLAAQFRAAVDGKGCVVCGATPVDAAHVIRREWLVRQGLGPEVVYHPSLAVPLCNRFGNGCHGSMDGPRPRLTFDLIPANVVEFVSELGLLARLEREYGKREAP